MATLFVILLIVVCVVLGFIVLIQNPKGGGLSSNIGGFSTQFMGVKQTTDVLEKGTWIFAAIVALLCLFSVFFMPQGTSVNGTDRTKDATAAPLPAAKQTVPSQAVPVAPTPAPVTPAPTK
jgi:preprotein translocase subunit SecG